MCIPKVVSINPRRRKRASSCRIALCSVWKKVKEGNPTFIRAVPETEYRFRFARGSHPVKQLAVGGVGIIPGALREQSCLALTACSGLRGYQGCVFLREGGTHIVWFNPQHWKITS